MAKPRINSKLVVFNGIQVRADRLPAGVKESDTVPVDEYFKQQRNSGEVSPARANYGEPRRIGGPRPDRPVRRLVETGAATTVADPDASAGDDAGDAALAQAFDVEKADYKQLQAEAERLGIESVNVKKDVLKAFITEKS